MEPLTFLTGLAISHYSFHIITNFSDYFKFMEKFREITNEVSYLKNDIDQLKHINEQLINKLNNISKNINNIS